jgi:hypothetical protein
MQYLRGRDRSMYMSLLQFPRRGEKRVIGIMHILGHLYGTDGVPWNVPVNQTWFPHGNYVYSGRKITPTFVDRYKYEGWRGRRRSNITWGEITQSFLVLSDVKLLCLGCKSSACRLRRVPALLVFYSSFDLQNTVSCKSQCIRMPPIVPRLKGKMFSDRFFLVLLPLAFSVIHSPSYCDVAQARSCFASLYIPNHGPENKYF